MKVLFVLVTLVLYVTMITYLSRGEVQGNSRERLNYFFGGISLWLVMWVLYLFGMDGGLPQVFGFLLIIGLTLFLLVPFVDLIKEPESGNTQKCVFDMILVMPALDSLAMLANGVNMWLALLALGFIPFAVITGRYIKVT